MFTSEIDMQICEKGFLQNPLFFESLRKCLRSHKSLKLASFTSSRLFC